MNYQPIGVEELFNSAIVLAANDYQKLYHGFIKKWGHEPNEDERLYLDRLAEDAACHQSHPKHIEIVYKNFIHDNALFLINHRTIDHKVLREQYAEYCREFAYRIEGRAISTSYLLNWYKYTDTTFLEKISCFYEKTEEYVQVVRAKKSGGQTQHRASIRYVNPNDILIRQVHTVPFPGKPKMDQRSIKMRSDYYKMKELEDFFRGPKYKSWTSIDGEYILKLCREGKVSKYSKKKYPSDRWHYLLQDEYVES